jgi:hypothetical protein
MAGSPVICFFFLIGPENVINPLGWLAISILVATFQTLEFGL